MFLCILFRVLSLSCHKCVFSLCQVLYICSGLWQWEFFLKQTVSQSMHTPIKKKKAKYKNSIVCKLMKIHKDNTFKYHVSCTDGKILVRIILIIYFPTVIPLTSCVFFPVGLLSLMQTFQQVLQFLLSPGTRRMKELHGLLKMLH